MIDEVVCFTDGSRLEYTGRTGASVFVESHNFKQVVPLGNYATVFQAKVYEPALGFSTIAVRSKVQQWAHNEHNKHWFNTEGCRQAEELVTPSHTWTFTICLTTMSSGS